MNSDVIQNRRDPREQNWQTVL